MSKKLDSAQIAKLVADAGKSVAIPGEDLARLIARIADILPPLDGAEEEKPPAQKKQYVVLVSDPNGVLANIDLAGWVLQIAEEESPLSTVESICEAAYAHNASKRGRMLPVQTIGEAIEAIPPRTMRQAGVWAKTREPVLVVRTSNEIPRTPSILSDEDRGIDPKRNEALGGFVKLCKDSGATMEIRTAGGTVKIDGDGVTAAKIGGGA